MIHKIRKFLHFFFFQPFPKVVTWVLFPLIPIGSFYLLEGMTHNPFADINLQLQVFSWIFYLAIYLFFYEILASMRWSYSLVTILLSLIGVANHYALEFHNSPILPWDLRSLNTALSVANNQTFTVTTSMKWIFAGFLLLLFLSLHCNFHPKKKRRRLILLAGSALLTVSMAFSVQTQFMTDVLDIYEMPFTQWYTYRQNGFMVSFFMNAKYMKVDKPDHYNADTLEAELSDAMEAFSDSSQDSSDQVESSSVLSGKKPNIIVIMDEAFSDLSVLGDFETNTDYLSFFRSLTRNTISGSLYVSVLGGNTANTEFEFLTGDTMAFLPNGSVPYQQYCQSSLPSLAESAKSQGYRTIAMHPYYASGWNRSSVYNYLGFDETYFIDDFKSASRIRQYVSDDGMFQKIISLYQQKGEEPLFLFGVTMQNHGSYSKTYDNFTSDVTVLDGDYPWANAYLSLIRETDQAYQNLINYFTYVDEPTIILFFGDHQPTLLERGFFNSVMGLDTTQLTLEESVLRYQTPFKLWANFDIEEESDVQISANYLGSLLFETAGLELSDYESFLSNLRQVLPIITANFYYDTENTLYSTSDDTGNTLPDSASQLLKLYSRLQYNHLFDVSSRVNSLFTTGN